MPRAEMTRRAALGAVAAAAVGYMAFGPRPRRERADGRLVLDYWEKWTQNEAAAMRTVVDRFNASQSRVFVRYFSTSAIDQKALIAIAGASPPDILGLGNFSIPAYAESGAILPLDDLANKHAIRRDAYAPRVWDMLTHAPPGPASGNSPRLYAVVNTCGALALFYNRALFRDAGLDPDKPPRTINELDAANEALMRFESPSGPTRKDDGQSPIARAGFLHMEPNWWTWHWGAYFGDRIYDHAADKATPDSPANVRAYRWARSYPERYGVERLVRFQTGFGFYGTSENPFLKGKIAMINQGPWLANVIAQYQPDLDYAVAPFPVDDSVYDEARPVGLLDCDVLTIPKGARDPEASMEFIAFTQRPENIELLSAAHGKNSPLVTQSESFERGHVNRFVAVHSKIANSPRAFVFPRTRTWQEYAAEFNAGMQRLWRLDADAPEMLATVAKAAQRQLDRAAAARAARSVEATA